MNSLKESAEVIPDACSDRPAPRHRLALICDLAEEEWPSMNLVGDMIFQHVTLGHEAEFDAVQMRPALRRRFSRLPLVGRSKVARNADRMLNRMSDYPRWLRPRADQFDLFHIVDHSYAQLALELEPARTVVTCHDLNTFRCLLEPEKEPRPRWFRAMTQRILDGMTSCARVVCASAAVRDEVLRHRLVPPGRLAVVHNGVHPSCSPLPDPRADALASELLGDDGGQAIPYLLHVGSTVARKRIDLLLEIFASVRKQLPSARLVRVGGPFTSAQVRLAENLGIRDAIHVLPFLDRETLAAIYRRASAVVLPSDAEGFGLPVVEALACGCPVIASDLPVLREVGGSGTAFCKVGDIAAWTHAVLELVRNSPPGAVERRRQSAHAHAAQFSWSATAQKLADIYRRVLKNELETQPG